MPVWPTTQHAATAGKDEAAVPAQAGRGPAVQPTLRPDHTIQPTPAGPKEGESEFR